MCETWTTDLDLSDRTVVVIIKLLSPLKVKGRAKVGQSTAPLDLLEFTVDQM